MLSRRRFISRSAAAFGVAAFARPALTPAPRVFRIASIVDPRNAALARGLEFGAAEAARSAALLDWRIAHVRLTPDQPAHRAGASTDFDAVIIGTSDSALPFPVPTLHATCGDSSSPSGQGEPALRVTRCAVIDRQTAERPIVYWHRTLDRFGAEQLNARFRAATGEAMTSDAWLGWVSMKILAESAMRAGSAGAADLARHLRAPTSTFDGHKGTPLRFGADGELVQPLYELKRDAGEWVVAREIAAQHAA